MARVQPKAHDEVECFEVTSEGEANIVSNGSHREI